MTFVSGMKRKGFPAIPGIPNLPYWMTYRGLNANMHTVEAFLAASDVTGDEKYRVRAGRIIDHVVGWASRNELEDPGAFYKGMGGGSGMQ